MTKKIFAIILNAIKKQGLDLLFNIILEALSEMKRARMAGEFDIKSKVDTDPYNTQQTKNHNHA